MAFQGMPPLVDASDSDWGRVSGSSDHHNYNIPPPSSGSATFGDLPNDFTFSGTIPAHFEGPHEQLSSWEGSGEVRPGWGSQSGRRDGFGASAYSAGSPSGFGGSTLFSSRPGYTPNNLHPSGYPSNWNLSSPGPPKLGRPQKYQSNLTRSNSYSPYSNMSSLTQSKSYSPYSNMRSLTPDPGFTRSLSSGYSSIQQTHAERPLDWRKGFSFRSGLASLVPRGTPSLGGDRMFGPKPSLHPYLRYSITNPQVELDLRLDPAVVRFRALGREANTAGDFTRLVCDPPILRMRLFHDRLPWNIDIQATDNPTGITFLALFTQMWRSLMTPIQADDFYNYEMDDSDREKITRAWRHRVGNNAAERAKGVLRVDFLRGHVLFQGLSRTRDGLWEIKTKKF